MPRKVTVYDVIIASPGDVATERQIAREVIQEWNAIHGSANDVMLNAVSWETHSTPEMGSRPQEIINCQILLNSDILIGIFWTRLGTPTGVAASGTVEEIQKHLEAGKPALLYFSAAPVQPSSVDSEQFAALRQFRKDVMSRGLVEQYASLSEFREKLARQVSQTVLRLVPDIQGGNQVEPVVTRSAPVLSDVAKKLLVNASQDKNGTLLRIRTLQGLIIQTNSKSFTDSGDPRSEATWDAAINELKDLDLLQDRGGKGEVFSLTNEGYRVVDLLRSRVIS